MKTNLSRNKKIRVAILDDHQGSLDGYAYRLSPHANIEIVATARFGNQVEPMLKQHAVDVLVLDVGVPTTEDDQNPYPILYVLPRLHNAYPKMAILVISMHKQHALVKAVMEAGANGYILKDDRQAIVQLGEIITSVAAGGVYFSEQSYAVLSEKPSSADEVHFLTKRQCEALSLTASMPNKRTEEVAAKLDIAPSTLRNLLSEAYKRLHVNNRIAAIAKARELGLISPFPQDPQASKTNN